MNDSIGYLERLADLIDRMFREAGMGPGLAVFLRTLIVAIAVA